MLITSLLNLFAQAQLTANQLAAPLAQSPADDASSAASPAIKNPLTLDRVVQWLADHGIKILIILVGMWILRRLARHGSERLTKVINLASGRDVGRERENRANTLASVVRNAANVIIVVAGLLMILQVLNIPITALLGGVAVAGLAVAFGAQNLIKDYFTGLTILLEDQYGVNDSVLIAGIAGQVERITLRMTVLRDQEGTAHFIPHGQVTTVSNRSHGWSRAVFDIPIAYKENVDRAIEVLLQLAKEIKADPKYAPIILDEPEMLGVNALGDSAVVIRFLIRTRPLQPWTIKRELQRRIKNKFDELGIEIPFPHQTVYLRTDDKPAAAADPSAVSKA